MYRTIIAAVIFMCACGVAGAQDLPPCFAARDKLSPDKHKLFSGVKTLPDGRTVYRFNLAVPLRCLDCPTGSIYYDSACATVASFTVGKFSNVYIRHGYNPAWFIESHLPRYAAKIKAAAAIDSTARPACIEAAIARPDSLLAANIISVQEVLLGNKTMYYFEPVPVPHANCYDCARSVAYYDADCNKVVFSVGGIAGIRAPAGFTVGDFTGKKVVRVLWGK